MRSLAASVRLFGGLALLALIASGCGSSGESGAVNESAVTTTPAVDDAVPTSVSTIDVATTSTTVAEVVTLPPQPSGPRAIDGTGGAGASYAAVWTMRPIDGEPYQYSVVKDGTERTAVRFGDVLYVDASTLDYFCVGLGGSPECAVAADSGANTLLVDGARVRATEIGPFALTNLAFMPGELGSGAPGLEYPTRRVGRLDTTCVRVTEGYVLARFAGAEYCETSSNVVAWLDRNGDGVAEVELTSYVAEVTDGPFEPPVRPVDDLDTFRRLTDAITR